MKLKFPYKIALQLLLAAAVSGWVLPAAVKAQAVSATATLDSSLMVIGGQMKLQLELRQPEGLQVNFPHFTDTLTGQIEIVTATPIDSTIMGDGRVQLSQALTITSFDSGLHYLPPLYFEYMEGSEQRRAATQEQALIVVNPFENVDPEKGFLDLKGPMNLPFILAELLPYFKWFMLFNLLQLLVAAVVIYLQRSKKTLKQIFIPEKPKEPAHVVALRELDRIKNQKLWQTGQVKTFYSQLTEVLRRYLEDRYHFPALEQTSGEILRQLKHENLPNSDLLPKLRTVLETADLAKFARFEPLADENNTALVSTYFFVNQTKLEPLPEIPESPKQAKNDDEKQLVK